MSLGYEDLNCHDELRDDPALALGCADITGEDRVGQRDKGHPRRLEWSQEEEAEKDRYKRTSADFGKTDTLLVDWFMDSIAELPERIILGRVYAATMPALW